MIHEDDVLEYALNNGVMAAAEKYNVSKDVVYGVVRKFKSEIDFPCSCEKAFANGVTIMCFMCDKQSRIRV